MTQRYRNNQPPYGQQRRPRPGSGSRPGYRPAGSPDYGDAGDYGPQPSAPDPSPSGGGGCDTGSSDSGSSGGCD